MFGKLKIQKSVKLSKNLQIQKKAHQQKLILKFQKLKKVHFKEKKIKKTFKFQNLIKILKQKCFHKTFIQISRHNSYF